MLDLGIFSNNDFDFVAAGSIHVLPTHLVLTRILTYLFFYNYVTHVMDNIYRIFFLTRFIYILIFITGEKKMAKKLEEFYEDINAVEFYVGLIMEKRRDRALFGESLIEIGAPYSLKGLMGNPICSPKYWKPSTFGGDVGFEIVNTASLKKLFCQNMVGRCPEVTFRVPDFKEGDVDEFLNKMKSEL